MEEDNSNVTNTDILLRTVELRITIQVPQKKGNPTLACHCALITGCTNVIFAWS